MRYPRPSLLLPACLAILFAAPVAHAQRCTGGINMDVGHLRIGGGVASGGGSRTSTASLALGAPNAAYIAGEVGVVNFGSISTSAPTFGVLGGMTIDPTGAGRVEACPLLFYGEQKSVTRQPARFAAGRAELLFGDTTLAPPRFDSKVVAFGGGVSVGWVARRSPGMEIVPFVSGRHAMYHATSSRDGALLVDENGMYQRAEVGAGFLFRGALALVPRAVATYHNGELRYGAGVDVSWSLLPSRGVRGRLEAPATPCADGSCAVSVQIQAELLSLVAERSLQWKVLAGCPRAIGTIDTSHPLHGTDLEPAPVDWAYALRNVAPLATGTRGPVQLPAFGGQYATIVYWLGAIPVHAAIVTFSKGAQTQAVASPFRQIAGELVVDADAEKADQAGIRRCR